MCGFNILKMINIKYTKLKFLNFFLDKNFDKILDIGCNTGYLSKEFAKNGVKVIGVDNKPQEINQENFNFIQQDIREFEFNENYDLVIASLVLHFFKKENVKEIINKIREATENGGYNFLVCMSNKDDCMSGHEDNFYISKEGLEGLYSSDKWEIIKSEQDWTDWEEHGEMGDHRHNLIFLIVKKNEE